MASTLAPAELFKYPWRIQTFLDKYKAGETFKLHDGSEVQFYCNPDVISWVQNNEKTKLIGPILKVCDYNNTGDRYLRLSDLVKTPEFGGKGKGFGVRIEMMQIDSINKQLEDIKLANNLSPSELLKYDWRIKVFLLKYGNEEPFEFVSGPKKVLVYSPQIAKLVQTKQLSRLQGPVLLGRNKKLYSISDLKMTKDFQEFVGFDVEAKEVKSTVAQIQNAKAELASAVVPMKIGNDIYEITGIKKTQGSPKSDFHFIDKSNKEIVWISHKDGKKPTDFQQWSGMTERGIVEEKEIKDFIDSVKVIFPLGMEKGMTVGRTIENKRLRMKSIYGINYGGTFGEQNVTVVAQGPIDIREQGRYYRLCSNHVLLNGDEPKDDYEPVMVAMYRGDRDQFGVQHARFAIYPKGGRIINSWI